MAKRKTESDNSPEISLEAAMTELGEIVARLESGQETLDESLARFERGMNLLRVCHRKLDAAAQRIELITQLTPDQEVVTEEFDATSTIERNSGTDTPRSSRRGRREEGDDTPLLF